MPTSKEVEEMHGKPTIPKMGYDCAQLDAIATNIVLGPGETQLHLITVNSAGAGWLIDIFELTSPTTSVGCGTISADVQGTFGYNVDSAFGFIIAAEDTGIPGNITIAYRVD